MEVVLTDDSGIPAYPFWKVAIAGDRAEVAEIPCDDGATENIVRHGELESRLRDKHPHLGEHAGWFAGWLTRDGEEAVLRLQMTGDGLDADDVERIGRAMSDWCHSSGVQRLAIADASRRNRGAVAADEGDWRLA